jgi:hypothetical protein
MFLASSAAAYDLNRSTAERNPGSSDFSGDDTSASMNSFDQTTMSRKVSSVVLSGNFLISTEQGPEVNAPDDWGGLVPASAANAFIVVIDNDWYDDCAPLEERYAWPGWEKTGAFMACCGVNELARSAVEWCKFWEVVDAVPALGGC